MEETLELGGIDVRALPHEEGEASGEFDEDGESDGCGVPVALAVSEAGPTDGETTDDWERTGDCVKTDAEPLQEGDGVT